METLGIEQAHHLHGQSSKWFAHFCLFSGSFQDSVTLSPPMFSILVRATSLNAVTEFQVTEFPFQWELSRILAPYRLPVLESTDDCSLDICNRYDPMKQCRVLEFGGCSFYPQKMFLLLATSKKDHKGSQKLGPKRLQTIPSWILLEPQVQETHAFWMLNCGSKNAKNETGRPNPNLSSGNASRIWYQWDPRQESCTWKPSDCHHTL